MGDLALPLLWFWLLLWYRFDPWKGSLGMTKEGPKKKKKKKKNADCLNTVFGDLTLFGYFYQVSHLVINDS